MASGKSALLAVLLLAAFGLAGARAGTGAENPGKEEIELSEEDLEILANLEFFENLELYEDMELYEEFFLVLEGGEEK